MGTTRAKSPAAKPIFFATPTDFRAWLEKNHAIELELSVGFHKRDSGKPSITWPESVDAALCYGWIDGVRNSIDAVSYRIRFTPRKPTSTWSAINVKRVAELTRLGLMHPAGVQAFKARKGDKTGIYAYEQRKTATLGATYEKQFRANKKAWAFFRSQPPWYQRTATYRVISAQQEATRQKRLAELIRDSEEELRIKELRGTAKKK
ncbi:MAG TPA: YdeI/OmpD-associated family protein [Terriglobales bacterium]|nr:YdeI/OmpD-associated family protein [Terriglobales bacterium]